MMSKSYPVAILFIGNAGAGKSSLLSQLGGKFESGPSFRKGITTERAEQKREICGENVTLMDVPGLFEPDNKVTESNSAKLTEALRQPFQFKIFFVLKATNSGTTDDDLVMMSKVNECIRQVSGVQVSFRVIVNQIMSDEVYQMYRREVARDNFQNLFKSLHMGDYSFDIDINHVVMLRFDEGHLLNRGFYDILAKEIFSCEAMILTVTKSISLDNGLVAAFKATKEFIKQSARRMISEPLRRPNQNQSIVGGNSHPYSTPRSGSYHGTTQQNNNVAGTLTNPDSTNVGRNQGNNYQPQRGYLGY